jgi:hypothetical protein
MASVLSCDTGSVSSVVPVPVVLPSETRESRLRMLIATARRTLAQAETCTYKIVPMSERIGLIHLAQ